LRNSFSKALRFIFGFSTLTLLSCACLNAMT
jgi:hypothetical protein